MKKSDIKVLVITGFGLNCERETAAACKLVGAAPEQVHLNDLIAGRHKLEEYNSWSSSAASASGTISAAARFSRTGSSSGFTTSLRSSSPTGKLVMGICNGFQTLTRLGMVPALNGDYFSQTVALAHNDSGVFRDDWCALKADPASPCVFTRNTETVRLPLRHGEGKFVADPRCWPKLRRSTSRRSAM